MKPIVYFKLLGAGAIALGATAAFSQPSYACPDRSDHSCSDGNRDRVVPIQVHPVHPPVQPCTAKQPECATPPVVHRPKPIKVCEPENNTSCHQTPVMQHPQPMQPIKVCVPEESESCEQKQVQKDYFYCGTGSHGVPTTFVNTQGGNKPLIRWVSHYFAHSGYTPQVRCQEVSQRFNTFSNQGILDYVTAGVVNQLPVICVTKQMGGACQGVLLTLKPEQEASQVIRQLFDVRAGAGGPLQESGSRPYIDLRRHIQQIK